MRAECVITPHAQLQKEARLKGKRTTLGSGVEFGGLEATQPDSLGPSAHTFTEGKKENASTGPGWRYMDGASIEDTARLTTKQHC
jgi:hypothetical protein